ncbi:DUF350 domain-containing protein [Alteromonas sp. KUL49]|uniref:DUF350 domain-containing protein n=1 Tax=Alteromonas sp. KUL49 TaxID=2480798 RepID=UPI00102F08B7|nr:DUF350 domain-containing protein [Alteromonas sp. KUL49]TAP41459.1 DUF350 domain-containing protein [Alteromonas sp. KUL49]GEA10540.1 ATP synthase F0 subunit A [Alteromonas sp. KUL49]
MDTLVQLIPLDNSLWTYLVIDFGIALALLLVLKWLKGALSKTSVTEELGVKDNIAFGISLAGGMLGLCIVLSAVVGRHIGMGYTKAAIGMLVFGAVGISLLKVGQFIHDKLVLDRVDTDALIEKRSLSVALVDAASTVASAIVLRNIMMWVDGSDMNAIIAITSGYLVVLTMLLMMTRLREVRYAKDNQNGSFQGALRKGNMALALEHTGSLLGTAIIVSTAQSLLVYSPDGYVSNVTGWLVVSVVMAVGLHTLVTISKRILLLGMSVKQEVDHQHNIGVASVGFVLSVGLALVVSGVLSH